MTAHRYAALSAREEQVLDQLESLFEEGFSHLTMADIANRVGCSLRLLYNIAGSRYELVAAVVDRSLWRIGRAATEAALQSPDSTSAIEIYLRAANEAVSQMSSGFAADLYREPSTTEVAIAHEGYLITTTRRLIESAIEAGELKPTDPAALASILAGMGRRMSEPDLASRLDSDPAATANRLTGQIIDGLRVRK